MYIYIYIENACGESPPPLAFGDLWLDLQTGVWAAKSIQKANKLGSRILKNPKATKLGSKIYEKINQKSIKMRFEIDENQSMRPSWSDFGAMWCHLGCK